MISKTVEGSYMALYLKSQFLIHGARKN